MIYLELFLTFLKIGAFTFGGGYAMLPLIQSEVQSHNWMTMSELVNFIAISESTPGPFAINISTYIGIKTSDFLGACCATLGVALPSFIIILIVAKCFEKFKKNSIINGIMFGLKPTVIGLIASTIISVGQTVFFPVELSIQNILCFSFFSSLFIFITMLILTFKKINPIIIIVLSAIIGIISGYTQNLII